MKTTRSLKVWAVIGDANARKTSTIRALTGVKNVPRRPTARYPYPLLWDVTFKKHRTVKAFVYPCALQEVALTSAAFVAMVAGSGATDVIVALRYYHRNHGDAANYLTDFATAGWTIVGCAVLGPDPTALLKTLPGAITIHVPVAAATPSNQIAARLRKAWSIV